MKDIVFPKNNEREFIELAQKLGYKELVFVYENAKDFYKKSAKISITNALLCSPKKVEACKRKSKLMGFMSQNLFLWKKVIITKEIPLLLIIVFVSIT